MPKGSRSCSYVFEHSEEFRVVLRPLPSQVPSEGQQNPSAGAAQHRSSLGPAVPARHVAFTVGELRDLDGYVTVADIGVIACPFGILRCQRVLRQQDRAHLSGIGSVVLRRPGRQQDIRVCLGALRNLELTGILQFDRV